MGARERSPTLRLLCGTVGTQVLPARPEAGAGFYKLAAEAGPGLRAFSNARGKPNLQLRPRDLSGGSRRDPTRAARLLSPPPMLVFE